MMLFHFCQDLRTSCEKAYSYVFIPPNRKPEEYEPLRKDFSTAPPEGEIMDRGMVEQLVDIAVSGVNDPQSLEKTNRPGGGTFAKPSVVKMTSKTLASEDYKEFLPSNQLERQDESLAVCREMENNMLAKLVILKDAESASKSKGPIYLVDMKWFDQWKRFLNGENDRPGPIINSGINIQLGILGNSFIAVDAKSWRVLSDLYKFDIEVKKEFY